MDISLAVVGLLIDFVAGGRSVLILYGPDAKATHPMASPAAWARVEREASESLATFLLASSTGVSNLYLFV